MSVVGRYTRTVMHLRPRQIWTRVARRVAGRPRISTREAPDRRLPTAPLHRPIRREDGWMSPTRVRLLNIEREFRGGIDWRPPGVPRLWTYTLNYFQDLPQCVAGSGGSADHRLDAEQASRVIDSWIEANPPGTPDTWDPYPISMRVVNWIKWLLLLDGGEARGPAGGVLDAIAPEASMFVARVLDSLALQLRYLERRIEFDIAANHLMANAVALTAGGLFFGTKEGDRWANRGTALLFRELDEQINEDGGHYERSPMYHAIVLEQLLDVMNLWESLREGVPAKWRGGRERLESTVLAMLDALSVVTHPDGGVSFFNDSTLGVAATLGELADYAKRLGLAPRGLAPDPAQWLGTTDFFRLSSEDGRTVVLFDAGVPAPRYQPGHAHSESLSFELSRDGRRVFVNSGISTYQPGPERLWQRQTAAHNTVRIDEKEQCEVWGAHRCGRRPVLLHAGWVNGRPVAAHNGYGCLPGSPSHNREMSMSGGNMEITDSIEGEGEHLLEWFFHLHPDVEARVHKSHVELLLDERSSARVRFPFGAAALIERGAWHPAFNTAVPNAFIRVVLRAALPFEFTTTVEWL